MKRDDAPDGLERLREIMRALRTPQTGCPWDMEQTFRSIAPYTIEEAYEVADAIERGDLDNLKEELGDLLLQVVFHAQMAEEDEAFTLSDVVAGICEKMVRRHPHVFGSRQERARGAKPGFWENLKAEEKAAARAVAGDEAEAPPSALEGVPLALPAVLRAMKLQMKAARAGFDWPGPSPVYDKLEEEIGELREAAGGGDPSRIEEEMGDLLFAAVNLARHLKVDPERALRRANAKFTARYQALERRIAAKGRRQGAMDLEEMEKIWSQVKQWERDG